VNLGLIPSSEESWPIACQVLKKTGGILHIHANIDSNILKTDRNDIELVECAKTCSNELSSTVITQGNIGTAGNGNTDKKLKFVKKSKDRIEWITWANRTASDIEGLLQGSRGGSWMCTILHIEHVKSYAPHVDHIVLDLQCIPVVIDTL
jgi:tRNA wybutosine-synthesizing protein 2